MLRLVEGKKKRNIYIYMYIAHDKAINSKSVVVK